MLLITGRASQPEQAEATGLHRAAAAPLLSSTYMTVGTAGPHGLVAARTHLCIYAPAPA